MPYVNKVTVGGVTQLDLSGDTITADKLSQGYTAHDASGTPIVGTNTGGGGSWPPSTITAGDTPVMMSSVQSAAAPNTSSLSSVNMSITITKAGTYRFKWNMYCEEATTCTTQLFKNGSAVGNQHTARDSNNASSEDIACNTGDTVEVRIKGGSYSRYTYGGCGGFVACINGDNGF